MKTRPTIRSGIQREKSSHPNAAHSDASPNTTPAGHRTTPAQASLRLVEKAGQRRTVQLPLRQEPDDGRPSHAFAIRNGITTRGEHNVRCGDSRGEALGNVEPVEPGELDVEQHDVGHQTLGLGQRLGPVPRRAHHREAGGLEQPPRGVTERSMVVDDQYGPAHYQPLSPTLTW